MKHQTLTKKVLFLCMIISLCVASGCMIKRKTYRIGVDPSWYPLKLNGKEANVFAFSNELLHEISKHENIEFHRINASWDNLALGLKEKKYEGILSSIAPHVYNLEKYSFSDLYLNTGPVLLIRSSDDLKKMNKMAGKEIVVGSKQSEALIIRQYPGAIVRTYDQIPNALNDLIVGTVDGVIIPVIPATAYVQDLYNGEVKIATPPLDEAGLRLLTIKDEEKELIERFNHGLDKLRDKGIYKQLTEKWGLE